LIPLIEIEKPVHRIGFFIVLQATSTERSEATAAGSRFSALLKMCLGKGGLQLPAAKAGPGL